MSVFLLILSMRYAVSLEENYYFEIQYGNFKIGQIDLFIKNKNNLILVDLSSNSDGVTNILYKYKSKILSKTLKTSNDLSPAANLFNDRCTQYDATTLFFTLFLIFLSLS